MDAVTLINKHIDMLKLLEHYGFERIKTDNRMIRSCCKLHKGDNPSAFVVNTDNNLWYCHTGSCGGGDAYNLIQHIEECNFTTAVKIASKIFSVDINTLQINERKSEYLNEMQKWILMMRKKTTKKQTTPFEIKPPLKNILKFRSFKQETLDHFNLKFSELFECQKSNNETYNLRNRLVIPIHDEVGVQIGASLRATKSGDMPKWSHQPINIKTSELLYNYHLVSKSKQIVICEGIFDVWAYHEIGVPAVCTYGAHLTESQYSLLIKSGADIILSFDGDDAGKNATKKAFDMLKYKANVSFVDFSVGQDPENITREELYDKFKSRRKR